MRRTLPLLALALLLVQWACAGPSSTTSNPNPPLPPGYQNTDLDRALASLGLPPSRSVSNPQFDADLQAALRAVEALPPESLALAVQWLRAPIEQPAAPVDSRVEVKNASALRRAIGQSKTYLCWAASSVAIGMILGDELTEGHVVEFVHHDPNVNAPATCGAVVQVLHYIAARRGLAGPINACPPPISRELLSGAIQRGFPVLASINPPSAPSQQVGHMVIVYGYVVRSGRCHLLLWDPAAGFNEKPEPEFIAGCRAVIPICVSY